MHVPDHLLSPAEAIVGGVAAAALVAIAVVKTKQSATRSTLPTMLVMGAFAFAAQMLNFPIIGAPCSGHAIGAILLASVLGPWAGFLTLSAVVAIQAIFFADGGLAVMGWNIINMAAIGSLVAYPLLFRRLLGSSRNPMRIVATSTLACTLATTLGAAAVVVENVLGGAAALPFGPFMGAMIPVHLASGAVEGIATGLILWAVSASNAPLLDFNRVADKCEAHRVAPAMVAFAIGALVMGFGLAGYASAAPDGLEWSMALLGK